MCPVAELKTYPNSVEFGEIAVVVNTLGKGLVFVKNSKQWINERAQKSRKTKAAFDKISRQASEAAVAALTSHPMPAPSLAVPLTTVPAPPTAVPAPRPQITSSHADTEFRGYRIVENKAERSTLPGDNGDWLYQMPPELPEISLVREREPRLFLPRGELGRVRPALRQRGTKSVRIVEPEMPRMPTSTDAFYRVLGSPPLGHMMLDPRPPPSMRSLPATHPAIRVPPAAIPQEPVGRGSHDNTRRRPAFLATTPTRRVTTVHEPSALLGHVDAEDSMDEEFAVHPAPRYYHYRSAAEGVAGPSNEVFLPDAKRKKGQFDL